MSPLDWLGLMGFVVFHYFSYPTKYQQYSDWIGEIIAPPKKDGERRVVRVSWFIATLIWLYDSWRFVALGVAAVGYWFFWKDPVYSPTPTTFYHIILGLHLGALVVLSASAYGFTYWFHSYKWRFASLIIVGVVVLALEAVALGFIIAEVVSGPALMTVTEVMALVGSGFFLLFILVTLAIYITFIGHQMSKHITLLYKRTRSRREVNEIVQEEYYQKYANKVKTVESTRVSRSKQQ